MRRNNIRKHFPFVTCNDKNGQHRQCAGVFAHITKKLLFFAGLMFVSLHVCSQTHLKGSITSGYAFNHAVYVNNERVQGAHGLLLSGSGNVEIDLTSSLFIDTGLSAKLILASGKTRLTDYRSRTLRVAVPVLAGWKVSDDLSLLSGVSIQNNRDFSVFRAREKYNLRYDLVLQGQYRLNNRWSAIGSLQYNFHIPDPYLINDPKMSVSVGLSFRFTKVTDETPMPKD